jgi:pyruvate dehydrogenase E1 component alpha subunit
MATQLERRGGPTRVITETGAVEPGVRLDEPPALLLEMYRWMTFGRAYDGRLISLQRQGRLTTYAPILGQEGAAVGAGLALEASDWLLGSYREGLPMIIHGMPAEQLALYFSGHPLASVVPKGVHCFPIQIGIADQIPQGAGVAWGMKLRKADTATLVMFGDGATSEGAFHEGLNFAGVFQVPAVFLCQNNGWAISTPRARQTHSETIADKGKAYGIPALQVDGNDVVAVYREVKAALAQARAGGGPTLIEAVTYRVGAHTTSDDPTRYRSAGELTEWRETRDPLARMRAYLESVPLWDTAKQEELERETQARVAAAVTAALETPMPASDAMFDHLFAEDTPILAAQRREHTAYQAKVAGDQGNG